MTDKKNPPPVGIDLGTTFSAIAFLDHEGRPETIRNAEGDLTTPSAVFFDHKHPIVGIEAVEAGMLEPDRLAQFAKRDVGERFYEKSIRGKHLPAEVIQALILRKLKADAELKLGSVRDAVITVPAFFNEPCRKATQDAGRLAGLRVLDIINEPTAAAITYGVQKGFLSLEGTSDKRETVMVYDLGGGTFDVTIMEIKKGCFNTIATAGDVYLGGIDWDRRLVDLIAEAFIAEHCIDPRNDPQAEQELLRKANQTKHALTQRDSVSVAFGNDGRRLRTEITQKEFRDRCTDLVERTLMTVHLVLDDAEIDWPDLTRLILVGGSTRMPMIRDELRRMSGMELDRSLSPDEAVCHGAALYAGMLTAGKNDQSGISVGNVNSHDLGVLAVDPRSNTPRRKIMIPRNSKLPARKMVRFRTQMDSQANVKIQVVEGGDKRGINATPIGKCVVADLPVGTPKGTTVEVQFDYRSDGRLTVFASLPEIDRKITMTLDRASGLSELDIQAWQKRLNDGLSDAALAQLPQSVDRVASELNDDSNADLPMDSSIGSALSPQHGSNLASNARNPSGVPSPDSEMPVRERPATFGRVGSPAPLLPHQRSSSDPSTTLGTPPLQPKPPLDLGAKDQQKVAKPDANDLAQLAALTGPGASQPKSAVPKIVIDANEPAEPKKLGGFFGRKKKTD